MLAKLHRYLAALLALPLLLVILSGLLLALVPLLTPPATYPVTPQQMQNTVERLQQDGPLRFAVALPDHNLVMVSYQGQKSRQFRDLTTGEPTQRPWQFQLLGFAKGLHKHLLIDAGWLVEASTWAMLALTLSGLFLSRPKWSNSAMGWHNSLGWYSAPLMLVVVITGLLMLYQGHGPKGESPQVNPDKLSLAEAFARLETQPIDSMRMVRDAADGYTLAWQDPQGTRWQWHPDSESQPSQQPTRWVRVLHDGSFGGRPASLLYALLSLAALTMLISGFYNWLRRWRMARPGPTAHGPNHLVAFASQTGTTAELARHTAEAMTARGLNVQLASLANLRPVDLKGRQSVRLMVATSGDGDMPVQGQAFLKALSGVNLSEVAYSLLGLGDSRYPQFCQAAKSINQSLQQCGAHLVQPMQLADGDPSESWGKWMGESHSAPMPTAQTHPLTLIRKQRLDKQLGDTRETWLLQFSVPPSVSYQCGDLLKLRPPGCSQERAYSIASAPEQGPLSLCVTLHQWQQDSETHYGTMSYELCRQLDVGQQIQGRISDNPGFHLPREDTPVIMVATGCGIAPFLGFLQQRPQGDNWLLFGNRHQNGDFLCQEQIEQSLTRGELDRLDLAFSRDQGNKVYIQDRLLSEGETLLHWLEEKHAVIYVCGHLALSGGVDATLIQLYQGQGLSQRQAQTKLSQLKAQGRYRQDVF
ncbi:PepSY domain-containing protein [Ferrimonas kyonanensis]|uniref:PepSY domain-containing protein n=1 Tax=Ferrimonas kyonanensis TaxID=364763 RepID=UPI000412C449|nr:PepSY domain-containing protein [Ferrimonas kyonanensis]